MLQSNANLLISGCKKCLKLTHFNHNIFACNLHCCTNAHICRRECLITCNTSYLTLCISLLKEKILLLTKQNQVIKLNLASSYILLLFLHHHLLFIHQTNERGISQLLLQCTIQKANQFKDTIAVDILVEQWLFPTQSCLKSNLSRLHYWVLDQQQS